MTTAARTAGGTSEATLVPTASADHFVTPKALEAMIDRLLPHLSIPKAKAASVRRELVAVAQKASRPMQVGDRLLRIGDVREKFGDVSEATLRLFTTMPGFPAAVELPSTTGGMAQRRWRESDIDAFIAQLPAHSGTRYFGDTESQPTKK